jgi:biopolymer transport protein ExbD
MSHASALSRASGGVAAWLIRIAAGGAPAVLASRLEEEWLADLAARRGPVARIELALGCCWAALAIRQDFSATQTSAITSTSTGARLMLAYAHRGASRLPGPAVAAAGSRVLCDINTTPLIDVLLVLLVTLIVSLPVMTHAVKLDLPPSHPPVAPPPPAIYLDIDFDGALVWNGTPVAGLGQLDSYFSTEAQKHPQAEIHLRPDRRAKYDVVAQVLASAQRHGMVRIGFVNTGEFAE